MSFDTDTKSELMKIEEKHKRCKKAEIYSFLLFNNFFYSTPAVFTPKSESIYNLFLTRLNNRFIRYFNICKINNKKSFIIKGELEREKLLSEFGYTKETTSFRINEDILSSFCCLKAFLRVAFLTCGNVYNPYNNYRIDFKIPDINLAKDLSNLISEIEEYNIKSKITKKQGYYILYIYGSENIENFLAIIGASQSAMNVMQVKMIKDERNRLNRANNFDVANIEKKAKAVVNQINSINKLKKLNAFDNLSDKLKDVALLRLNNKDSSLEELHKISGISKSSINYRLNRIIDIASKINPV